MKIGVYIGSFNPVHKGHIEIAKHLVERNYVDKLLILPTPNYWNKQDLVDINHRVNMLKLLEEENIIVDDTHNNYPFTYEVLNALKKDYKDDELYIIMGVDNLEKLHLWKNVDEIFKYNILLIPRGNTTCNIKKYPKEKMMLVSDFKGIDISSTQIRKNLNNKYLDEKVRKYIIKNNLYKEVK